MERHETVAQTVARVLGDAFPDVEVVDRDLSIGRERSVQLAAVDAGGRLLLVLCLEQAEDAAALLALDALAYARRNAAVLAGHFHNTRLRAELPPLLVVVAREFDEGLVARLGSIDPRFLRAFELRHVSSSRGAGDYLAEIDPAAATLHREQAGEPRSFLDALDAAHRPTGELLLRRIAHLDEELEASRRGQGLAWRLREDLVCCVSAREGAIDAQVPGMSPMTALQSREDVERFLEAAVQRYLTLLHSKPFATSHPGSASGREPLLTAEELAAFETTR